jgi:methylated-DNA-[protein]-cysteine S-methyltransferase
MRNSGCGINNAVFRMSLGWVGAAATEQGICRVVLPKKDKKSVERELKSSRCRDRSAEATGSPEAAMLKIAEKLLRKYFSGERVSFDVPLDLRYYTPFQQAVWKAAAAIPSGETRSYAWIAKRIRNPKAVRAVGQALGANPVPIVIPCHRVISSAGTMGGYSGGIKMKKTLLELEADAKVHH